jgi:hypothetical protein
MASMELEDNERVHLSSPHSRSVAVDSPLEQDLLLEMSQTPRDLQEPT